MKKAIPIFTAALMLNLSGVYQIAEAAVSPSKQRAAEVKAIVDTVAKKLPKHPIHSVMYIRANNFEVLAGTCSLRAHILTSKTVAEGKADKIKVRLNRERCQ
ncbi:hypothetical protein ACI0FM_12675 [Paenochrobactrum sp. BZR 588]|uniref:hypothetical protein n=1 Tax=Paenochrobactrum TaxID=999488 RepID=UPI0035BC3B80